MKTTKSKSVQHNNRNLFRITKQVPVQTNVIHSPFIIKKVAEATPVRKERTPQQLQQQLYQQQLQQQQQLLQQQQEQNEQQKSAVQEYLDYVHSLEKLTSKSNSKTFDPNEMTGTS